MILRNKKKPDNEVKILTSFTDLLGIEECLPRPASSFTPAWWKTMPYTTPKHTVRNEDGNFYGEGTAIGTAKRCPSFPEYFSEGYIIPMWVDMILSYDKVKKEFAWRSSDQRFIAEAHPPFQFTDYVDPILHAQLGHFVARLICPWRIVTPKGYSVYQLPLYYHFNQKFSVLPGVIRTDELDHQINQQVLLYGENAEEIFIPRGTPLVQYIPFKRTKYKLKVDEPDKEELNQINKAQAHFDTRFPGSGEYLRRKKIQDMEAGL